MKFEKVARFQSSKTKILDSPLFLVILKYCYRTHKYVDYDIFMCTIKKFKVIPVHAMKAGGGRSIAPVILNHVTDWCKWSTSRPGRFIPDKKNPCSQLNRRLDGPYSPSWRFGGQKNCLPLPGFEPGIVQLVAWLLYRLRFRGSCYIYIAPIL